MNGRGDDSDSEASETDQNPLYYISPEVLSQLAHLNLAGWLISKRKKSVSMGAYGDISRGRYTIEGRGSVRVAIKCLRFYLKDDIRLLFEKEIYVWSKLKHKNILSLLGYDFDGGTGYPLLISEWVDNGSAWVYVRSHPEADMMHLVSGIAHGLAYLHEEGIIHSDIKSDNILVSNDGEALICDFGCSRMLAASRTLAQLTSDLKGTSSYLAYELVTERSMGHTKQSDVWAFGMTVFELLSQKRPFEGLSDVQAIAALQNYDLPPFPEVFPRRISAQEAETLKDICLSCWNQKPLDRPSMTSVAARLEVFSRSKIVLPSSDAPAKSSSRPTAESNWQSVASVSTSSIAPICGEDDSQSLHAASPHQPYTAPTSQGLQSFSTSLSRTSGKLFGPRQPKSTLSNSISALDTQTIVRDPSSGQNTGDVGIPRRPDGLRRTLLGASQERSDTLKSSASLTQDSEEFVEATSASHRSDEDDIEEIMDHGSAIDYIVRNKGADTTKIHTPSVHSFAEILDDAKRPEELHFAGLEVKVESDSPVQSIVALLPPISDVASGSSMDADDPPVLSSPVMHGDHGGSVGEDDFSGQESDFTGPTYAGRKTGNASHAVGSATTVCVACSFPIDGAFVRALGNVWHLLCFKCTDCDIVVASKFFPIEGSDGKQWPLCERDYFRRLNLICAKCDLALRGSYITACNRMKKYHVEHFTCSVCPTLFGPQDSYYEHENDVYCHFHYSTRFADKCVGCNSAILKQFVESNRHNRFEYWHPECYMINKFWNVKIRPTRPNTSAIGVVEEPWKEEEQKETAQSLRNKQVRMEQKVYRIWTVLSTFEASARCISDTLRQPSNGQYLDTLRMAEKFILHVEVLFATIDDTDTCLLQLKKKGMSHVREARLLCRKTVDLFTLLSRPQDNQRRVGMTLELLALVKGLVHYLRILIRIALTDNLKLERDYADREAMANFLDKLHLLAVQGGSPSARRAVKGNEKHTGAFGGVNSTRGVTYGYKSLAPESAGESPLSPLDDTLDSPVPLMEHPSVKPPSDLCVKCGTAIEEDCARLGTYQRWHSHCLQCSVCGKASAPIQNEMPRDPGSADEETPPSKVSTERRLPANIDIFVYEPQTAKDSPFGPIPTVIFCRDHQRPGSIGGFQAVTRLEQYAFLLHVALRRLSYILKQRGILLYPAPSIALSRWSGFNDAGIRAWASAIPAGSASIEMPRSGLSPACARPDFPLSRQRPAGPALCTDSTQPQRAFVRSSSPISLPSPRAVDAQSYASYSNSSYPLDSALQSRPNDSLEQQSYRDLGDTTSSAPTRPTKLKLFGLSSDWLFKSMFEGWKKPERPFHPATTSETTDS